MEAAVAREDSYLKFSLTSSCGPLLGLPHFEIRNMAKGRLKRTETHFFKSNVFLSILLAIAVGYKFHAIFSSFFAIKVRLSPLPLHRILSPCTSLPVSRTRELEE